MPDRCDSVAYGVMVNRCVADVASAVPPFRAVTLHVCTSGSSATVGGSLVSVAVIGSLDVVMGDVDR